MTTSLLSMSPILELRGSLLFAMGVDMNPVLASVIAIISNMIPIPFIILFIRRIFAWIRKNMKWLGGLVERMEAKGNNPKNRAKVEKYGFWGLLMFVAIPLPGTGAWTAALVAAMLDMRLKKAVPAICIGVISAGLIVTLAYAGLFGAVGELLK